jgi:hypothetical protein
MPLLRCQRRNCVLGNVRILVISRCSVATLRCVSEEPPIIEDGLRHGLVSSQPAHAANRYQRSVLWPIHALKPGNDMLVRSGPTPRGSIGLIHGIAHILSRCAVKMTTSLICPARSCGRVMSRMAIVFVALLPVTDADRGSVTTRVDPSRRFGSLLLSQFVPTPRSACSIVTSLASSELSCDGSRRLSTRRRSTQLEASKGWTAL